MPGDHEIAPEQIASARGGLTIITYSMVGKPGVIACVLADQIVAAAYANSTDKQIAQRIASVEAAPQMTLWLDEADALAGLSKMDNLLNIVTQGRQLGVAGRFAMVSKPLAMQKLGAEAANTLLESVPVTWYLTPSGRELEELAREFGMREVYKITRAATTQSFGPVEQYTKTTTPQSELILKPDDVLNLPEGTVIVRNRPGKPGERIMLVQVPDRCYEPDSRFGEVRVGEHDAAILVDEVTIVMDAMNEAIERNLPGAPWAAMRPDIAEKYASEPEPADEDALLELPRPTVLV
jgi:TraM recognition site of TraD and TraG